MNFHLTFNHEFRVALFEYVDEGTDGAVHVPHLRATFNAATDMRAVCIVAQKRGKPHKHISLGDGRSTTQWRLEGDRDKELFEVGDTHRSPIAHLGYQADEIVKVQLSRVGFQVSIRRLCAHGVDGPYKNANLFAV